MAAIVIRDLSKRFTLHQDRPRSLQELVLSAFRREANGPSKAFWAIKDVSFQVVPGEALALIGENGSGKSTLLKLIARILEPTHGEIQTDGRLAALLELGAGFHPDLTGRDNIYLNGSFLGLSRREMTARFDEIVGFAELERFIDVPLKHYSSGMQVRLGFAIATSIDPDILLIDEVLAVGDESFQHKCLDRIRAFGTKGKTIVLVSHDLATISDLCSRAVLLENGEVKSIGLTRRVVDEYLTSVGRKESAVLAAQHEQHLLSQAGHAPSAPPPVQDLMPIRGLPAADSLGDAAESPAPQERPEAQAEIEAQPPTQDATETPGEPATADKPSSSEPAGQAVPEPAPAPAQEADEPTHWGTEEIQVSSVRLLNSAGESAFVLQSGEPLVIQIDYEAHIQAPDVVFGIGIYRHDGLFCYGTNTDLEGHSISLPAGPGSIRILFDDFSFIEGTYSLDVAIHTSQGVAYDYHRGYCTFALRSRHEDLGVYRPRHHWEIGALGDAPLEATEDMMAPIESE